jgi:hypothetical protein
MAIRALLEVNNALAIRVKSINEKYLLLDSWEYIYI